jgi:membrane fusion protein (multidrug efflux system)
MVVNLRSIAVSAAVVIAAAGLGWFAISNGDSPAPSTSSVGGRPQAPAPRGGPRPSFGGPVTVVTATMKREPFAQQMEAVGTARANEAVDITSKVSNRVTAIRFREGQQVKAGDVLVEFDSQQVRATLAEAEAALSDSRSQYKRSRELYTTKALSEAQLDQIEATLKANEARVAGAQAQLNDTIIRAPFDGRVGLRNISVGSYVSPGTVITTLDDTSIIKLDFSLPEVFLASLQEGLEISARTAAYPDAEFRGKVTSIDSRVDPVSRSITVRAHIDNKDGRLRPGMFMTVRVMRDEQPTLMVPEEAIVPEGSKRFVFVVRDGKAVRTEVVTGRRRPGEVEAVSGLEEGDVVVIEGTQKIRDGVAVKAVPAGTEPGA